MEIYPPNKNAPYYVVFHPNGTTIRWVLYHRSAKPAATVLNPNWHSKVREQIKLRDNEAVAVEMLSGEVAAQEDKKAFLKHLVECLTFS